MKAKDFNPLVYKITKNRETAKDYFNNIHVYESLDEEYLKYLTKEEHDEYIDNYYYNFNEDGIDKRIKFCVYKNNMQIMTKETFVIKEKLKKKSLVNLKYLNKCGNCICFERKNFDNGKCLIKSFLVTNKNNVVVEKFVLVKMSDKCENQQNN